MDNQYFGFLNIDKPAGMTSHDVVMRVRRLLKIKKVGHTGTLDPLATGVLPLCLGRATRLIQFLDESEKAYQAHIHLGIETDTNDREGKIVQQNDSAKVTRSEVENACRTFIGEIEQVPPMYSAIKINGKKLYKLARAGKTVHREPRKIQINEIRILAFDNPLLTLSISCSRGTYVRSLVRDLGRLLDSGAHLKELRRTRSGPFCIDHASPLENIEKLYQTDQLPLIMPEEVLSHLQSIRISEEISKKIFQGVSIKEKEAGGDFLKSVGEKEPVKICNSDGKILAIGNIVDKANSQPGQHPSRELHPRVVLSG